MALQMYPGVVGELLNEIDGRNAGASVSMRASNDIDWQWLAGRVIDGERITKAEALSIVECSPNELLDLLHAAFRIRQVYFGRDVHLHVLRNARSGSCPEDCRFCSQSSAYNTGITDYPIQTVESLVEGARAAKAAGAARYCMVTATRGPSKKDLDVICEAVETIKGEYPELELCTSLGLLNRKKAQRLKDAGVDRYNHNLETSAAHFANLVQTHGYEDRVNTIQAAHDVGMESCCGGIVGMGETLADQVDLAFALRDLGVASIPVNFLDPRPGTPMGDCDRLTPHQCLVTLAMFRFVNPTRDIRVAGGREVNLGSMQAFALYPANSIFTEGYLTTSGNEHSNDHTMIKEAGFNVLEVL